MSYFNDEAKRRGLLLIAISRGTAPNSTTVPSLIIEGLRGDGFDVTDFHPSAVTAEEVRRSRRTVTIGTSLPDGEPAASSRTDRWDDVPPATRDYAAARRSLKSHVAVLLDQLGPASVPR